MKIIAVIDICVFASGDHNTNLRRKMMYRSSAQEWREYLALIPMGRDIHNGMGNLWERTDFRLLSQQSHAYNPGNADDRKEAIYNMRAVFIGRPAIMLLFGQNCVNVFNEVSLEIPYEGAVYEIRPPFGRDVAQYGDEIRAYIQKLENRTTQDKRP